MAQIVKSKMHWREKYGRIAAEGELYFVQKIWDRRTELDGTRSYLVPWKGYPSSERNWEPQENFFCPESRALVEQFDEEKDLEEAEAEKKCLQRKKKSSEMSSGEQQHFDEELQDALDYLYGGNIPEKIREALEAKKVKGPARPLANINEKASRKSCARSKTPQHKNSIAEKTAAGPTLATISETLPRRSSRTNITSQHSAKTSSTAYTPAQVAYFYKKGKKDLKRTKSSNTKKLLNKVVQKSAEMILNS